jgi:lysophospholipase L1-like esterase
VFARRTRKGFLVRAEHGRGRRDASLAPSNVAPVAAVKRIFVAVLAAAVLSGCTRAQYPAYPIVRLTPECAHRGVRLTFVGDSLARGWGASTYERAFASLVYADVREMSPKSAIRNLGTPGATTDDIAAKEVPRLHAGDCSLVVIIAGANDVQKLYTPHHFATSYATLLRNVRARLPQGAIVVMGLPDVSLAPLIPWPLKPYDAAENGAAFVPLYDLSHRDAYRWKSLLSRDGIHPNDAGYRLMADAALPSIRMVMRPHAWK